MFKEPERSLDPDLVSALVVETCTEFISGGALNGVVAGDGRLVEGRFERIGGVEVRPPGENLDGTVPARARRYPEETRFNGASGTSLVSGVSIMVFSRSRKDEDGAEDVGMPHPPPGVTPSSAWISRALSTSR